MYENEILIKLPDDLKSGTYEIEINLENEQYPLIFL